MIRQRRQSVPEDGRKETLRSQNARWHRVERQPGRLTFCVPLCLFAATDFFKELVVPHLSPSPASPVSFTRHCGRVASMTDGAG